MDVQPDDHNQLQGYWVRVHFRDDVIGSRAVAHLFASMHLSPETAEAAVRHKFGDRICDLAVHKPIEPSTAERFGLKPGDVAEPWATA